MEWLNTNLDAKIWNELADALDTAVALRESGDGGGHAALIQILNRLGYFPLSSREAERVATRLLSFRDGDLQEFPDD